MSLLGVFIKGVNLGSKMRHAFNTILADKFSFNIRIRFFQKDINIKVFARSNNKILVDFDTIQIIHSPSIGIFNCLVVFTMKKSTFIDRKILRAFNDSTVVLIRKPPMKIFCFAHPQRKQIRICFFVFNTDFLTEGIKCLPVNPLLTTKIIIQFNFWMLSNQFHRAIEIIKIGLLQPIFLVKLGDN